LRACEIKALQWKHISWEDRRLSVRRSKTPAGWRDPSLNETCFDALRELHGRAGRLGFDASEHFLFPWHGQHKRLDPTRPMTSWRTAWRSLRKAAGLPNVRFHDGRHAALTRLAEKGLPDWVIRAQFGHVSPSMMAVYSHVRRKALDEAAKALEPETTAVVPPIPKPSKTARREGVTSHVTSQQPPPRSNVIDFPKEVGAPCMTRTCDLLVRSQTLYPTELRARKGWVSGDPRGSTRERTNKNYNTLRTATIFRPCRIASVISNGTAQQNQLATASCSGNVPTFAALNVPCSARNVTNANVTT